VLAINRKALGYFRDLLQRPAGEKARRYLDRRGIKQETAEAFLLGYAPEGWSGLKGHLAAASVAEDQGVAAGLLARKDETGRTYDRFRDRVMFPILALTGEVIGFGGRVIDGGEPKYLNSPETAAFSKGENLYAVGPAKDAIRREGYAILVEGYMDVIALHQAGVTHAVATLGTGFTAGHVRLLKRFTDRVVVNFDPDAAGRAAARRSLEVLLEHGFEVQVAALPAGQDPDLFVREQGAEAYRSRLAGALPYIEFLAREIASRLDLGTPRGKVEGLNQVLPFLAQIDNPVRRAAHVETIASVLGIEDRMVLQELKEAVRGRRRAVGPAAAALGNPMQGVTEAETRLLRALLDDAAVRAGVLEEMEDGDVRNPRVAEIVGAVRDAAARGEQVTYPRVAAQVSEGARDIMTRVAALSHPPADLEAARGCLRALRAQRLQRQMGEIQKRLETGGDAAEIDELLRRKVALKKEIEALGASA
jgi:DNA primase